MKLIDADLVLDKMRNTFDMQDLYLPSHFKELIIDDLPTVEAIPIDKVEQIRAEIEQEYNKYRNMSDKWDERACGLGTALEIIDKAIKEQSK